MASVFPSIGKAIRPRRKLSFKILPIARGRLYRKLKPKFLSVPRQTTPTIAFVVPPGYASELEYIFDVWLQKHGYREGIDYQRQVPIFGGRTSFGGQVFDFVFYDRTPQLVVTIIGGIGYYHDTAKDMIQHIQVLDAGYDEVRVLEPDIRTRPDYTFTQALAGFEVFD